MAQVYPEDRGTNYAIRDGRASGRQVADDLVAARTRRRESGERRAAEAQPRLVRR
jgi:hypothetical protein